MKKFLKRAYFGSMLSLELKNPKEATPKFINGLRLTSHLVNFGDAKTLVIQPAVAMLGEQENRNIGVSDDLLRVSVTDRSHRNWLTNEFQVSEHNSDIIADFEGALSGI